MLPFELISLDDPALKEADEVVRALARRGIDVFFSPVSGVALLGTNVEYGVAPSSADMDMAYALKDEIGMLFALRSFAQLASSSVAANGVINQFTLSTARTCTLNGG